MDILKIGIVIADSDEFLPLEKKMDELCGRQTLISGRKAYEFNIGNICVTAVLCGIGKVNAAVAATALAEKGVQILLNCGLSGGISGVKRGNIVVPEKFLEHDFDLRVLGYKLCEKPSQNYIYKSDEALYKLLRKTFKTNLGGTAVTGDCFVSDAPLRDTLKAEFSATTCDMETAAIAYVAESYGIKFASVRKVSDDAGNDAAEAYTELNVLAEDVLISGLLTAISDLNK